MNEINQSLQFLLNLAKAQNVLVRRFDGKLNGLSLSEFMILYSLSQAENEKMRRVDLAEQVGLTASGVTRLLLPMEKIGLVKKESNENDARVSLVCLASGGKRKLSESLERAGLFAQDVIPLSKINKMVEISEQLEAILKILRAAIP